MLNNLSDSPLLSGCTFHKSLSFIHDKPFLTQTAAPVHLHVFDSTFGRGKQNDDPNFSHHAAPAVFGVAVPLCSTCFYEEAQQNSNGINTEGEQGHT